MTMNTVKGSNEPDYEEDKDQLEEEQEESKEITTNSRLKFS
jgi:hypothetical protein